MKKSLNRILAALLFPALLLTSFSSCTGTSSDSESVESDTSVIDASPIDPSLLGTPSNSYTCGDGTTLKTYTKMTATDFSSICEFYRSNGYSAYSKTEKNGSLFATYVKGDDMAHLYWLKNSGELSIVTSESGASLPPVTPSVTTGEYTTKVVQMTDKLHNNGMGYIIQLADGSFIVYDGAYVEQAEPMIQTMESLNGGEKPLIRAWVITHAHGDHYLAFRQAAQHFSDRIQVEYVMVAPVPEADALSQANETYFYDGLFEKDMAKLTGAKAVYIHTGMEFTFCNLKLEILLSPDDLYKYGNHDGNFNNSSIVSRLYDNSYSALFLGDTAIQGSTFCSNVYGSYLKSNMCQIAHHGVENVPLSFYMTVQAPILFYPCDKALYDLQSRNNDVREALEKQSFTKEILIAGLGQYTVEWGKQCSASDKLVIRDYT